MTYEFDEAIAFDGSAVTFPDRWTMVVGFAHGGYLMSTALAAASTVSPRPDAVTMSAHFVRPGKVGGASIEPRLIKAGRTLATVEADIIQDGNIAVATITTFGDLSDAGEVRHQSIPSPDLPPREACARADRSVNPAIPVMVDNIDLLLTPDSTAWALGEKLQDATMRGWVRHADGRPIDALSIPMFADALPPPVFNVGAFAPWTPTVELTVHIRRRPTTDWLGVSFRTELIGGTFFESSGTLWDEDGHLVAMSRQLQLIQKP